MSSIRVELSIPYLTYSECFIRTYVSNRRQAGCVVGQAGPSKHIDDLQVSCSFDLVSVGIWLAQIDLVPGFISRIVYNNVPWLLRYQCMTRKEDHSSRNCSCWIICVYSGSSKTRALPRYLRKYQSTGKLRCSCNLECTLLHQHYFSHLIEFLHVDLLNFAYRHTYHPILNATTINSSSVCPTTVEWLNAQIRNFKYRTCPLVRRYVPAP